MPPAVRGRTRNLARKGKKFFQKYQRQAQYFAKIKKIKK